MATSPKYPPDPHLQPQLVQRQIARQERAFKLAMAAIALVVFAAVVLVALWLLKYGGGSPQEQPKPKTTASPASPSGMFVPSLPRL